eukprot:m.22188 g.22188  ORF g.22188 m.22188 type:complete len:95 (-) comp9164_c0_seq6:2521-2805(-)
MMPTCSTTAQQSERGRMKPADNGNAVTVYERAQRLGVTGTLKVRCIPSAVGKQILQACVAEFLLQRPLFLDSRFDLDKDKDKKGRESPTSPDSE